MDKPDNCGPTYIIIGDGGNEEGVENDFTQPQAGWSAYRDLAFGQAEFTILNDTAANWTWKADDGAPLDQVCVCVRMPSLAPAPVPLLVRCSLLACWLVCFLSLTFSISSPPVWLFIFQRPYIMSACILIALQVLQHESPRYILYGHTTGYSVYIYTE